MQEFKRETAIRIFAQEFIESDLTFKEGDDERAPRYLLTPTGARCNRLFIVGTLTEKEDIGIESEYWRARVADPTGVFLVYAGQYNIESMRTLSDMDEDIDHPNIIAVTGKPNTYETDGVVITSVRPESIQVVDAVTRDTWIIDTAIHTMKRLKKIEENGDEDILKAREHYSTEIEYYKEMVLVALKALEKVEAETIDMSGY